MDIDREKKLYSQIEGLRSEIERLQEQRTQAIERERKIAAGWLTDEMIDAALAWLATLPPSRKAVDLTPKHIRYIYRRMIAAAPSDSAPLSPGPENGR